MVGRDTNPTLLAQARYHRPIAAIFNELNGLPKIARPTKESCLQPFALLCSFSNSVTAYLVDQIKQRLTREVAMQIFREAFDMVIPQVLNKPCAVRSDQQVVEIP